MMLDPPARRAARRSRVRLLPREAVLDTRSDGRGDRYYRPILGWVQRLRFHMASELIGDDYFPNLLELGYGGGVFMPELDRHCDRLYGADTHAHARAVSDRLQRRGIRAHLYQAAPTALPFETGRFQCIVAAGSMPFVLELAQACAELRRVLAPGGALVVVGPGRSPLLDRARGVLERGAAGLDFAARRDRLTLSLLSQFDAVERRTFPTAAEGRFAPALYTGYRLR